MIYHMKWEKFHFTKIFQIALYSEIIFAFQYGQCFHMYLYAHMLHNAISTPGFSFVV